MNSSDFTKKPVYPKCISEMRRPKKAPDSIVVNGKPIFGAFDSPILNLNIDEVDKPLNKKLPQFINRARIKEWEAYEVCFDEGFICGALYDMGVAVFNILIFYDRETGKVTANQIFGPPRKCINNSLINTTNHLKTCKFDAQISNQLQDSKVYINANYSPTHGDKVPMATNLTFTSCADPCVVVMPLGEERPLYTHKGFFKAAGTIKIGDRTFTMNERSVGIIDDHKGYYPLHMHYDWITGMACINGLPLGFNLCKNQCTDPVSYSENCLWINGDMHPLPPVDFTHEEDGNWHVYDNYDWVNINFEIDDSFNLRTKVGIISAMYTAPYGKITGYVRDLSGNKISLEGLTGMGEDIHYDMI